MAETDLYAPAAARGHREPRAAFGSTMAGKPNDTISLARLLRLHPTSSTPHAAAAKAPQSRGAKPRANSLARGRGSRRRLQQDERPAKGGMSLGTGWRAQITAWKPAANVSVSTVQWRISGRGAALPPSSSTLWPRRMSPEDI